MGHVLLSYKDNLFFLPEGEEYRGQQQGDAMLLTTGSLQGLYRVVGRMFVSGPVHFKGNVFDSPVVLTIELV